MKALTDQDAAHVRFLRGLAHEVRTPLASILMLTELIADRPEEMTEKQLAQVRKIRRATADLNLLMDHVSMLAKVADGSLTARRGPVDLEDLMEEITGELAARAGAKGLEIEVMWEPRTPRTLSTDRLLLRMILVQLLDHALGASRDSEVTVSVTRSHGELAVAVRDQGTAVPEDRREAVFEAFPEIARRTGRSVGGTALALPLARALAGLLGARLVLTSDRERGVTLTLLLPLTPDPKG